MTTNLLHSVKDWRKDDGKEDAMSRMFRGQPPPCLVYLIEPRNADRRSVLAFGAAFFEGPVTNERLEELQRDARLTYEDGHNAGSREGSSPVNSYLYVRGAHNAPLRMVDAEFRLILVAAGHYGTAKYLNFMWIGQTSDR